MEAPRTVLLTGATSGFGWETAKLLANHGFRVIAVGRRAGRLRELQRQIEEGAGDRVYPLCLDIRSQPAVEKALGALPEGWQRIGILINNAGLAVGLDPIHRGQVEDWERMIDTNVKGLLYVTRWVSAAMVERGIQGHIVNIGSIAGTQVYPHGNAYCATKHAVHALSQGMRQDLLPHRIRVTEICPGMAETEFSLVRFKGDAARAKEPYAGVTPLSAHDVAQAILFAITRPPHVCINHMEITATAQANAHYTHREGP